MGVEQPPHPLDAPHAFAPSSAGGAAAAAGAGGGKKVFVGGLSWETDERSLRDYFGRWGSVTDCVIMRDRHTGHPRGFGFVTYACEATAERVAAARHELDGRQVEAKRAVPRSECTPASIRGGAPGAPRATRKVFVGGLPATCGQAQFVDYFARFGPVADAQVMYDHHTGNSRGFGFVTFHDEATVDRICTHDAHDIMGKFVDVKRAEPRQVLDARRNAALRTAPAPAPGVPASPHAHPHAHASVQGGTGTLESAALYAPDVPRAVHANLYADACPPEAMSVYARTVASARVERRYHPYASRERRVLRCYW